MLRNLLAQPFRQRVFADWPRRWFTGDEALGAMAPQDHEAADMDHARHAGPPGGFKDMECPLHVDVEAEIVEEVVLEHSRSPGSDREMQDGRYTLHRGAEAIPVEDVRLDPSWIIAGRIEGQKAEREIAFEKRQDTSAHLARRAGHQDEGHDCWLLATPDCARVHWGSALPEKGSIRGYHWTTPRGSRQDWHSLQPRQG
jgi:hypothetical protein